LSDSEDREEVVADDELLAGFDAVIAHDEAPVGPESPQSLIDEGDALLRAGRFEDALVVWGRVLERFGEAQGGALGRQIPNLRLTQSAVLVTLDRLGEAETAFDELCTWTRQASDPDWVLAQIQDFNLYFATTLHKRARALLKEQRYGETIAVADVLLGRFGGDPPPGRLDLVVDALRLRATALADSDRAQEGIELLGELVERYRNIEEPAVRTSVAGALIKRADLLNDGGEQTRALDVFDELIARFGDAPDPDLREKVAYAFAAKASTLLGDDRNEEAIAAVDEMLSLFGEASEPELCVYVARALANKAVAVWRLGRLEDAIAVDDEVIARFADAAEAELSEWVAWVLGHKASSLRELGRVEESIAVWGDMIDRYSEASSPVLRERVATALRERAELLVAAGRCAEAIDLADALIARGSDEHDPQQTYLLAQGLAVKGAALLGEKRLEDAIVPLDALIAGFQDADPTSRSTAEERRLRTQVAFALRDKAVALYRLGRDEEAKAAEDEMVTRFGEDALAGFDELSSRHTNATDPQMRELLVSALQGKAVVLAGLDRQDEALQVLTELIERFQNDENPDIQNIVAEARKEILDGDSE